MKAIKCLFGFALTLAVVGCSEKEEPQEDNGTVDEAYYAEQASISSSSSVFTSTGEGGAIAFPVEGGKAVITVSCGTDWTVENSATDLFDVTVNAGAGTIVVGAYQNEQEQELTATISLYTLASHIVFATITVTQEAYTMPRLTIGETDWHAPAVGELTTEIEVDSSIGDWEIGKMDSKTSKWLTAEKTDTGLRLTSAENEDTEQRSGEVKVTCTDGVNAGSQTITVLQDGQVYLTSETENITFFGQAESKTISVESNFDWTCTCESAGGWLSVQQDGSSLVVNVEENEVESDREGTVTITAGDGAQNTAEVKICVTELIGSDALIFTYSTTGTVTVTLPLTGTVNCLVDWGDGSEVDSVDYDFPVHVYKSSGQHYVKINGTVSAINSQNIDESSRNYLRGVYQWGRTGLADMSYAFYQCYALTSVATDTVGSLSNVTSMEYAFFHCYNLRLTKGVFDYCTEVTTFAYAFHSCYFTSLPSGLFDNCGKVTTFERAFYGCIYLTSIPEGFFSGCKSVTSFYYAFADCLNLVNLPAGLFSGLSEVNTFNYVFGYCWSLVSVPKDMFNGCIKAESFNFAFRGCSALRTIPSGLFDECESASTFSQLFYDCTSLESIPDGLFSKCRNAKDFTQVFMNCSAIKSIPEDLFSGCTSATTLDGIFWNCTSITSVPAGLFKNCTSAERFWAVFYGCSSLTTVPEDLFANCPNVTTFQHSFGESGITTVPEKLFANNPEVYNFAGLFYLCSNLASVPTGLFDNCRKVTHFKETFNGCSKLTEESPYTIVSVDGENVKVHLYEREKYTDTFVTPIYISGCFLDCNGMSDYEDMPDEWKYSE